MTHGLKARQTSEREQQLQIPEFYSRVLQQLPPRKLRTMRDYWATLGGGECALRHRVRYLRNAAAPAVPHVGAPGPQPMHGAAAADFRDLFYALP